LNLSPRAVDHLTGSRAGVLALFDDDLSIDKHVVDPFGREKRLLVGCAILNFVVIEDDDICIEDDDINPATVF